MQRGVSRGVGRERGQGAERAGSRGGRLQGGQQGGQQAPGVRRWRRGRGGGWLAQGRPGAAPWAPSLQACPAACIHSIHNSNDHQPAAQHAPQHAQRHAWQHAEPPPAKQTLRRGEGGVQQHPPLELLARLVDAEPPHKQLAVLTAGGQQVVSSLAAGEEPQVCDGLPVALEERPDGRRPAEHSHMTLPQAIADVVGAGGDLAVVAQRVVGGDDGDGGDLHAPISDKWARAVSAGAVVGM